MNESQEFITVANIAAMKSPSIPGMIVGRNSRAIVP